MESDICDKKVIALSADASNVISLNPVNCLF